MTTTQTIITAAQTIANSTVLAAAVAGAVSLVLFLIGRHDNKNDVFSKIEEEIASIKETIEELKTDNKRGRAVAARIRILNGSDEVVHGERHSREWWDQILDDITFYENYCDEDKDFKNKKAVNAKQHLNDTYVKVYERNDFI